MSEFIKEYWLWILLPFVLVVGGIGVLILLSGSSGDFSDFTYNVF